MDWDNAMRQMIVAIVQEQIAPLRRDIADLQNVNNELVATLKAKEGALKLCIEADVLLSKRINDAHQRMDKLANDAGDAWQLLTASHTPTLEDLKRRVAALEFTSGGPVSELDPQDVDEALRAQVQPLRDDPDDATGRLRQYMHDTDDRLNALEARHAPEEPAKAPESIVNICAALEAEYTAFVRSAVKDGLSRQDVRELLAGFHADHALRVLLEADDLIDRMYVSIDGEAMEAA